MLSKIFFYAISYCLIFGASFFKPAPLTASAPSAHISVTYPVIPVLKRLDANPVALVRIYLPPDAQPMTLRSMHGTLSETSIASIDKLQLYVNGDEPLFSPDKFFASVRPNKPEVSIPLNITINPGLNYIWVGATLRDAAFIEDPFQFAITHLEGKDGQLLSIDTIHGQSKKRMGIALRKKMDDSVHTYRIPGLIATDKGTLIAVYDIRYDHAVDLPANIDVGMSRSTDGGRSWEKMKVVLDMGEPHKNNGVGDPAILFDPVTKKLWVAALWSKGNRSIAGSEPGFSPDTTGQFVLVSSTDDGRTWSAPQSITSQVKKKEWHLYFNGPGTGIAMDNGTLVFPSQYWDETKKPGIPYSSIIYSTDHGRTWRSGTGARKNTTEAQIVEVSPNKLLLNMRDNRGNYRSVATTTNLGKTWTDHPGSYRDQIDPVCMASLIKAEVNVQGTNRQVLFFSNPKSSSRRHNLTIQASLDAGDSWPENLQLLIDERDSYGYSSLVKTDDHTIGILYEGIRDLYFVRIPVKDILSENKPLQ